MSELNDPRVLFAAERTLLAWNRTSLSLIAFGFIVERAGLLLESLAPASVRAAEAALSFWIGVAFIALGALASAYSIRQYAIVLRSLTPGEFPPSYAAKWGMTVNAVVAVLGALLALVLVLGRAL
jgi:putative membrane protein